MLKVVLFDLDGLLVDTERLGIAVAVEVCRGLGIELSPEEQQAIVGIRDDKFYGELFERHGLPFDVANVLARHFALYEERLRTDVRPFPGARTLPALLTDRGYTLALVSGSTRRQIDMILDSLGITHLFPVVVSCDDVATSKPDPEGYLLAAKLLGVEPAACVVLEDAWSGSVAGKRAGMRVIGVVNAGGQDLSAADLVVSDLGKIERDLGVLEAYS